RNNRLLSPIFLFFSYYSIIATVPIDTPCSPRLERLATRTHRRRKGITLDDSREHPYLPPLPTKRCGPKPDTKYRRHNDSPVPEPSPETSLDKLPHVRVILTAVAVPCY